MTRCRPFDPHPNFRRATEAAWWAVLCGGALANLSDDEAQDRLLAARLRAFLVYTAAQLAHEEHLRASELFQTVEPAVDGHRPDQASAHRCTGTQCDRRSHVTKSPPPAPRERNRATD